MKTRLLSFVAIAMLLGGFLAACSNLTGTQTEDTSQQSKRPYTISGSGTSTVPGTVIGPITPVLRENVVFDWDESAPALTTLANYPSVVSWRLKLHATLPKSHVLTGNVSKLKSKATVFGFDGRGNQIASGTAYVANENNLNSWYCTVQVDGVALDMAQAGALITDMVYDIEVGGDGDPTKRTPCWVLAAKAAGGVAGSIVGGATVLAACFGTGGAGCPAAILTYIAAEGKFVEWVVDWYCQCIDEDAVFC